MERWHNDIAHYQLGPSNAIAESLATVEDLNLREKDKVRWIMDSDQMYEWLSNNQSCVLVVEAETPPENLRNSISFTTSLLARSLTSTTEYAVLSFLCGLETEDLGDEDSSGPLAILKALNGQFLKFIVGRRPSIDLLPLEREKSFLKSGKKFKYAIELFDQLLGLLEENDAVFVLIDSFSRMPGEEAAGDKVLNRIIDMIAKYPRLVIKILITDPLPNCPLKDRADFLLHLPDHVDGGQNGLNIELLEEENDTMIEMFKAENARMTSSSDDSDDEW